ncbi:MAG TPA: phosphate ABC transporter permease subunit PstC [Thermoplasmata archaeon]|nr:phosphate ABC transporter permease subunit PstC [Thermoplasmata archaeon]
MAVRSEEEGPQAGFAARIGRRIAWFRWTGRVVRAGTVATAVGILLLAAAIAALLLENSLPSIDRSGLPFLWGSRWDYSAGVYGAGPAIFGTLLTSALALLVGVPVALGVAIFTSELAPRRARAALAYLVDLGAMVPSVVYGMWGLLVVVPFMSHHVEPALDRLSPHGGIFSGPPSGLGYLTAGLVLAVMVIPTIGALSREALRAVPRDRREAALGLGATRWEAARIAVFGPAAPGILSAVILGLGRALGETIAVVLVIGNVCRYPTSLLSGGCTIPSQIVNYFGLPGLEQSALYELGLVLFALSLAINIGARVFLHWWHEDGEAPKRLLRRPGHSRLRLAARAVAPAGVAVPAWWTRVAARRRGRILRRRAISRAMFVLLAGAVVVAVYPLFSLAHTAVDNGGAVLLRPSFYTEPIAPACLRDCTQGGIGPAIQGTLLLVGLASGIGLPVGVLAGIYLSEYGRHRWGRGFGVVVDAMVGLPSLLIGVFVFAAFLEYDRTAINSVIAGGIALSIIMIPIVTRTTETALRSVPTRVRESALALGFPRHRITLRVVLGSCRSALVTGCLLAIGRATGETAALLFTIGATTYGFSGWNHPVAALAPFIFQALLSAYPNWVADAWGAALVLLLIMLGVTLAARLTLRTDDAPGAE